MSDPLVSIVIPACNQERFVTGAIESILAQTLADLQLIVIDDGSTDRTPEAIRHYDDPRLCVISQENRSLSATLNLGLQLAQGRFFAFLDADGRELVDDPIVEWTRVPYVTKEDIFATSTICSSAAST